MGIGFCRLTPSQFWSMTPQEFYWRYEAEIDREKRSQQMTAQLACWVISPWLKKPITVRDLMPERVEEPKQWTADDWRAWAEGKKAV